MSDQNTLEIQTLRQRWAIVEPNELTEHKLHDDSLATIQHVIDCIWKRGWSVTVEYFEPNNVQASLDLNNDFDGPQYVSSNFDIMPDRRETDALEALLLVYVAALEESLIRV